MNATMEEKKAHDLIDVIDLYPVPGEYAGCKHPMEPFEMFGVTVQAWHRYHAMRRAVSQRWEGKCECCGHGLRYAHVTQDENGEFHCFGRTCLSIEGIGEEGTRRLEYSERIEEKKSGGFCATFNVPSKFWDLAREDRPAFARPWKGKAMTRKRGFGNSVQWKLSIWGDCFEACLDNCMALSAKLGIKLS